MWVPIHCRPSFTFNRKRKRTEEAAVPSPFLKEPVTEKLKCENVKLNGLEIGHASMQGFRVNMEDEHIIENIDSVAGHTLVAVMDGEQRSFRCL
jgi:polygalacturonase